MVFSQKLQIFWETLKNLVFSQKLQIFWEILKSLPTVFSNLHIFTRTRILKPPWNLGVFSETSICSETQSSLCLCYLSFVIFVCRYLFVRWVYFPSCIIIILLYNMYYYISIYHIIIIIDWYCLLIICMLGQCVLAVREMFAPNKWDLHVHNLI